MDRSLDDVIQERQNRPSRPSRDRRPPRDGVRKNYRYDDNRNLDRDWVHDRYDEESDARRPRESKPVRLTRRDPVDSLSQVGQKIKVENIHYDLTEDDLKELFNRIGPVRSVSLVYDRQDRSTGVAYIIYSDPRDARVAVEEFDGANANGQPIRLSLVNNQTGNRPGRNPFDTAERPSRSLFDRIERRVDSDDEPSGRRSNVNRPPPEHIDRYIPGQENGGRNNGGRNNSRRRSPRRDGRNSRRPGQRRPPRENRDAEGHALVQGRPRKTAEELDAEMEDYWGGDGEQKQAGQASGGGADQDIDMDI